MKKAFIFAIPLISVSLGACQRIDYGKGLIDFEYSYQTNIIECGDKLSIPSLKIKGMYDNGSKKDIPFKEYTFSSVSFDSFTKNTYPVTIGINDSEIVKDIEVTVKERTSLKLLMIGNSFSDDTIEYAYDIANSLGIKNIELANLYLGGCTIDSHYENAAKNNKIYELRTWNDKWVTKYNSTMQEALKMKEWDFISLQQASGSSGKKDTYTHLDDLITYVKKNSKNKNAQLVWNMTWAYQSDSNHQEFPYYNNDQREMYSKIIDTVNEIIVPNKDIACVIPTGTAIQNGRTSYIDDIFTRDGYHLQYNFGRYFAGLTLVSKLTGVAINDIEFRTPDINDDAFNVAVESVNNAIAHPFEVTKSIYTD